MEDASSSLLELAPGVRVPEGVVRFAFSRSSGPGGQNVNKLSTKAELRVSVTDLPISARAKQRLATLAGHERGVLHIVFSPDGSKILTTSSDRTGRIWDADTGALLHTLPGHGRPVMSGAFSPDGKRAVTASHDKNARIWDVATGALLATLPTDGSEVQTAVFSPDGTRLLTATFDGNARIWDVSAYQPR